MNMLTDFRNLVKGIVGGRAYPLKAAESPTAPYLVYFRPTSEEENDISVNGGTGNAEITRLQVTVWSKTYLEAQSIAESVKVAMKGWSTSNVKILEFDDIDEETDLYGVVLEFSVIH